MSTRRRAFAPVKAARSQAYTATVAKSRSPFGTALGPARATPVSRSYAVGRIQPAMAAGLSTAQIAVDTAAQSKHRPTTRRERATWTTARKSRV
jgi:uncharacterized protein YoaH (UPF0181 family)